MTNDSYILAEKNINIIEKQNLWRLIDEPAR
jgi:hypothetical protein